MMQDMTLKMFGSQVGTTRMALAYYRASLEKLAKKEDEAGITSEQTRSVITQCDELLEALAPPEEQTDAFKQPPEGFETPKPWNPDTDKEDE